MINFANRARKEQSHLPQNGWIFCQIVSIHWRCHDVRISCWLTISPGARLCKWADGSPSSTLPVSTRTVWIDSVNSMTQVTKLTSKQLLSLSVFLSSDRFWQNLLRACEKGETKIEQLLSSKPKLDQEKAIGIVDEMKFKKNDFYSKCKILVN